MYQVAGKSCGISLQVGTGRGRPAPDSEKFANAPFKRYAMHNIQYNAHATVLQATAPFWHWGEIVPGESGDLKKTWPTRPSYLVRPHPLYRAIRKLASAFVLKNCLSKVGGASPYAKPPKIGDHKT